MSDTHANPQHRPLQVDDFGNAIAGNYDRSQWWGYVWGPFGLHWYADIEDDDFI